MTQASEIEKTRIRSTTRIQSLVRQFESLGIDTMLVTDELNVHYLTGFTGDSSVLWVRPQETVLLSDGRYTAQIAKECPGLEVSIRAPEVRMPDFINAVVGSDSKQRIGYEANHLTVALFNDLQDASDANWISTTGVIESLRMIKDEHEIAILRRAVAIAEDAFLDVGLCPGSPPSLDVSLTEMELAYALEAAMRRHGASGCSFDPIVAVDAAGALPHYRPGPTPIAGAKSLLIDWGAKVNGYASDMTRTLHTSGVDDDFAHAYAACLAAQEAAIAAIKPGVAAQDIDAAARNVLTDAGYGDAFKHALGHGVGLFIHEAPRMGGKIETPLQAGMVVTVEPGIYLDNRFGIRIEDDVLITTGGHEVLGGRIPKGLDEMRGIG
ncbi:MAG: Xaa-Pro peptidase family protein [Planctomycetota bacterium]